MKEGRQNEEIPISFTFPVVDDTLAIKAAHAGRSWLSDANYNPLYIGKQVDTIKPDYALKYKIRESSYSYETQGVFPDYHETPLSVYLDTNSTIKNYQRAKNSGSDFLWAHPVIVKNETQDTLEVGYGQHIPLFLEAQDSTGQWRNIEEQHIYLCGVGLNSIILPPDQIVLTSSVIQNGNYQTKGRLRIGRSRSEPFQVNINYRQFTSMFLNGEYREEYLIERDNKNDSTTKAKANGG